MSKIQGLPRLPPSNATAARGLIHNTSTMLFIPLPVFMLLRADLLLTSTPARHTSHGLKRGPWPKADSSTAVPCRGGGQSVHLGNS